jgi:hypothetical protein
VAQAVAEARPVVAGDEHGERPADQRPPDGAEQLGRAPVGVADDREPVGDQVGHRGLLEQRPVAVQAFLERVAVAEELHLPDADLLVHRLELPRPTAA